MIIYKCNLQNLFHFLAISQCYLASNTITEKKVKETQHYNELHLFLQKWLEKISEGSKHHSSHEV